MENELTMTAEEVTREIWEDETETGEEKAPFTVDTDEKAEWAIRKIAEEKAECDRMVGCCQAMIESYQKKAQGYREKFEKRIQSLSILLEEYFRTVPATKETKTQVKYDLPSGSLVLKKASTFLAPDAAKLTEWLASNDMNDYLKAVITPRWDAVKKQLEVQEDGGLVFKETGEYLPEGIVAIETKAERFEVSCK